MSIPILKYVYNDVYRPGLHRVPSPDPRPRDPRAEIREAVGGKSSPPVENGPGRPASTAHGLGPGLTKREDVLGPCCFSIHPILEHHTACTREKGAASVSGGFGRTGDARSGRGIVWYDGRRVSRVQGSEEHLLLLRAQQRTAASAASENDNETERGVEGGRVSLRVITQKP